MLYTSTAVYVLGERGAWRGVERRKPPYRPSSGMVRRTTAVILFYFIFVRYTLPFLWRSSAFFAAVLLLYYYRTHIVGSWVVGYVFLLRAVLYYCCTTFCCCAAVVRGAGGGSVRGCVHGFVGGFSFVRSVFFFPRYTGPALASFGAPLH